jgi:hypothetical protein
VNALPGEYALSNHHFFENGLPHLGQGHPERRIPTTTHIAIHMSASTKLGTNVLNGFQTSTVKMPTAGM